MTADRVIARQGEIGTGFFIIAAGSVRVDPGRRRHSPSWVPATSSGSCPCWTGKPRNAQVVSTEPTTCLALASWDFEAVVRDQPSVALAILRELAGRLRELTEARHH